LAVVVRRLFPAAEADMPDEEERPSTGIDAGDGGAPITEALAQAFLVSELQVARPSLAALPAET
jgi:hypothetical protein